MAGNQYSIGQYRYTSGSGGSSIYVTNVSKKQTAEDDSHIQYVRPPGTSDADDTTKQFKDICIVADNALLKDTDYHLSLQIPRDTTYSYDFDVLLTTYSNGEVSTYDQQYLQYVHVSQAQADEGGTNWVEVAIYSPASTQQSDSSESETEEQEAEEVPGDDTFVCIIDGDTVHFTDDGRLEYESGTSTPFWNSVSLLKTWMSAEGQGENYATIDIVFRPLSNDYNAIYVKMYRTSVDYKIKTQESVGRIIDKSLVLYSIDSLSDIVGNLNMNQGDVLMRIGVWSHPGLLMAINGESVQVGQSGYYELENIPITSLAIQAETYEKDNFSIDYQYIKNS